MSYILAIVNTIDYSKAVAWRGNIENMKKKNKYIQRVGTGHWCVVISARFETRCHLHGVVFKI